MTYQDTVTQLVLSTPRLFKSKLEIDDHLFTATGNGYKWEKGQLVDIVTPRTKPITQKEAAIREIEEALPTNSIYQFVKAVSKNPDIKEETIKTIIDGVRENLINGISAIIAPSLNETPNIEEIYIGKYCRIREIPDDLKPDWEWALVHFIDWCLNNIDKVKIEGESNPKSWLSNLKYKITTWEH